jgi:hypothetical protein
MTPKGGVVEVGMDLKTLQKLWWPVALFNFSWCLALWLLSQGVGANLVLLENIDQIKHPPVFGPLVSIPTILASLWLARRHIDVSKGTGLVRLPQPPDLALDGQDGLKVRLVLFAGSTVLPVFWTTHLTRKFMLGDVWARVPGEQLGPVWRTIAWNWTDAYRFFNGGPTIFPIIQPLLYGLGLLWCWLLLIRVVLIASRRAAPITRHR